jgi:Protein of unknown function (DUF4232)
MRIPALSISSVFAVLLLAGCSGSPAPTASDTPSSPAPSETPSAAPSPSASAAEQIDPSAPPGQCKDTALKVTLSAPDGAAGSLHYVLTFMNTGTTDCILEGYPTVYVVGNGNNTEFGVVAGQDAGLPTTTVTIEAAHSAVAVLTAVDIEPGGGPLAAKCTVGHGDGYVVRPPHSYHQYSIVAAGVPACTNGAAWMTVGAVQAG